MRSVLLTAVLFGLCHADFMTDQLIKLLKSNLTNEKYRTSNPDAINTDELIKKEGLKSEVYTVITEDGYVLRLTRIRTSVKGPPVLLVHGLFEASDTWVQRGRKEDLAFYLADKGFDIWLADLRGNAFSHKHQFHCFEEPTQFYRFSFYEIGKYDLPAIINKILKHSTYNKIGYIGHCMGTSVFFSLTSVRTEYNDKIKVAVMLSPLVFGVKKFKSKILKELTYKNLSLQEELIDCGVYNVLPNCNQTLSLIRLYLFDLNDEVNIAEDILLGEGSNVNKEKVDKYLKSLKSGATVKSLFHFAQMFKTGEFQEFDYGPQVNLKLYQHNRPTVFRLFKVTVPVAVFYGAEDHLVDESAIEKLGYLLPKLFYKKRLKNYGHFDYVFGTDVPTDLYAEIAQTLSSLHSEV